MPVFIAVCGSDAEDASVSAETLLTAEHIGALIAQRGGVVVCGGRGGIMEAACKGASQAGGLTIGLLPNNKDEANAFVTVPLATGLGMQRNVLVVSTADAVIALAGRWGTLNEISYAMIQHKPVVLMAGTGGCVDELVTGHLMKPAAAQVAVATSAADAVEKAFALCQKQ